MSALDELDKRFEDGTATALELCIIWGDDAEWAAAELAQLKDANGKLLNAADLLMKDNAQLRAALDEARKVIEANGNTKCPNCITGYYSKHIDICDICGNERATIHGTT